MMTTPDQTYLDTLLLYFEEEIEGEAYFRQMSKLAKSPPEKERLRLLAEVERHAAEAVRPLIDKYHLHPRPTKDLAASGVSDANATEPDWKALLSGMRDTYPGYLADFRALEALGPPEDQDRLSFLTEHEVAALDFLDREEANDPRSTEPLKAYLASSHTSLAAE